MGIYTITERACLYPAASSVQGMFLENRGWEAPQIDLVLNNAQWLRGLRKL